MKIRKKKTIYLFVEVFKREFSSRLEIKLLLESLGFNVVIGDKDSILDSLFLRLLPPGIILDKCAKLNTVEKGIRILNRTGFKYSVLDEEGIHTFNKEVLKRIGNPTKIDLLLFNNKYQYLLTKKVISNLGIDMPNYAISGNPRLIPIEGNSSIEQSNLRYVYIIGNYNYIYGKDEFEFYQDKEFKELILKYLCRYKTNYEKNYQIIYRPHPSENSDVINFCEKNNIMIDTISTIQEIANKAEIVITNRCTVNIQCQIFNKSIKLLTFYNKDSRNIFTRAGAIRFDSLNSLITLLDKFIDKDSKNPKKIISERERILDLFSSKNNPAYNIALELSSLKNGVPLINKKILYFRVLLSSLIANFMNLLFFNRLKMKYKYDNNLIKKARSKNLLLPTLGYIFI